MFPAWSPDGLSIAFLRYRPGRAEVLLIPALGGPERRLGEIAPLVNVPLAPLAPYLAWLPDGKSLVTFDRPAPGQTTGLCVLSVASGEKRFLTTPPPNTSDVHPAVSPDGRTVAFVRAANLGASHLYLLSLGTDGRAAGEPRRLDLPVAAVASPAWTADGREIVCRAGGPYLGDSRLWVVPAAGSGEPRPLATGENGSEPAVSRRGNRLVYSVLQEDSDIWRVDLAGRGASLPEERLIASTRSDITPQYSPDGSKIAFSSERSGHSEIWMCDSDGSNPVQVTTLGTYSGTPRWFPDGRRIVFDSQTNGQADLYVVDTTGGAPRRLTDDPSADVVPSVSGDGKWVLFVSTRTGRFEIWKVPAEGGPAVQVTRQGGFMPFGSRDNKTIYYQHPGASFDDLWSVPAGGGEERRLLGPLFNFGFAVMGDGIFFIGPGAQGGGLLQFFDFAKGARSEGRRDPGADPDRAERVARPPLRPGHEIRGHRERPDARRELPVAQSRLATTHPAGGHRRFARRASRNAMSSASPGEERWARAIFLRRRRSASEAMRRTAERTFKVVARLASVAAGRGKSKRRSMRSPVAGFRKYALDGPSRRSRAAATRRLSMVAVTSPAASTREASSKPRS